MAVVGQRPHGKQQVGSRLEGRRVVRISTNNGNTFKVLAFDNNHKELWFSAISGNIVEIQFSVGINLFVDRKVIE